MVALLVIAVNHRTSIQWDAVGLYKEAELSLCTTTAMEWSPGCTLK